MRPVSGSSRVTRPTAGSSRSRGSRTSTASRSCRPDSAAQRPFPVERPDEVGDDDHAARAGAAAGGAAPARRPGPRGRRGRTAGSRPACAAGAAGAGGRRGPGSGSARCRWRPPRRSGCRRRGSGARPRRPPRPPGHASRSPRCRSPGDAERSATSQVSSSRSATVCRMCGSVVRAVTDQSIRRTSSPGLYGRASPGSVPGPGTRPRWLPCSRPSSRRRTVSSRVRQGGVQPGRVGGAGRRRRAAGSVPVHRPAAAAWPSGDPRVGVRADLRQRDGLQQPAEDRLDRHPVGQRVVGQHEPVPQHVGGDVDDVLRDDEVAAADQRQRAGGGDDAERRPAATRRRTASPRPRSGRARPGVRVANTSRTT